jgi:hypothetical protein
MFYNKDVKYVNEEIGSISFGPAVAVKIKLVSFNDFKNNNRKNCDVRLYNKSVKRGEWLSSFKGIVFNFDELRTIYEELAKIPDNAEAKPEHRTLARFEKNQYRDLVVGLILKKGTTTPCIDVREWVGQSKNGYTGFTQKGFRIPLCFKNQMLVAMSKCLERMVESTANLDKKG